MDNSQAVSVDCSWAVSKQISVGDGSPEYVLFVPQFPYPADDPGEGDYAANTPSRNGGFVVDLNTGIVDISTWASDHYLVPKDYKSVILIYLPKLIAAKDVDRLFPLLKLHKTIQPGLANPGRLAK